MKLSATMTCIVVGFLSFGGVQTAQARTLTEHQKNICLLEGNLMYQTADQRDKGLTQEQARARIMANSKPGDPERKLGLQIIDFAYRGYSQTPDELRDMMIQACANTIR